MHSSVSYYWYPFGEWFEEYLRSQISCFIVSDLICVLYYNRFQKQNEYGKVILRKHVKSIPYEQTQKKMYKPRVKINVDKYSQSLGHGPTF